MSDKPIGRPRKFKEEMEREQFLFPASLSTQLEEYSEREGRPKSDIVRDAVTQAISAARHADVASVEDVLRSILKPEMLRDAVEFAPIEEIALHAPRPALSPLPAKYQKLMPSHLPVFKLSGKVSAGSWREAIEEPQFLTARDLLSWQNDDEDFLLEINPDDGDCLMEDGISPGDYVHMRSTPVAENGDIVLAVGQDVDGVHFATLKHWHRRGNKVELRPSNPKSKTIFADVKEVEVHGVVMNSIKRNFKKTKRK